MLDNISSPARRAISDEEWQERVNLAACYRLLDRFGMSDLIYNHVTARVPGEPEHFLINQFGMHYSEMTASSLLKIDDDGNVIAAPDSCELGVNRAGYVIHSAVHMARSDVNCVIHTHTRAGSAVSSMRQGLLPISQTALRFVGAMGYHDFEGPATDTSERERLVADLGAYNALVLRNHGLLVCGRTIAEAFVLMHRLEAACRIQVDAMASGDDILIPGAAAQARTAALFSQNYKGTDIAKAGTLEWKALVRMLDRQDSSFRD